MRIFCEGATSRTSSRRRRASATRCNRTIWRSPVSRDRKFTLRSAVRAIDRQYQSDAQLLAQAQDSLQQLSQAEGRPGANAHDWAMSQAGQDLIEMRAAIDEMVNVESAYRSAIEARDQLDRASQGYRQSSQAHGTAREQRQQASAQSPQAAELLELLRDAEAFIGGHGARFGAARCASSPSKRIPFTTDCSNESLGPGSS